MVLPIGSFLRRIGAPSVSVAACFAGAAAWAQPAPVETATEPAPAETQATAPAADSPTDLPADQPALPAANNPWTVQLRPWVWYVAPSGDLRLPLAAGASGTPGEVDLDDINADATRLRPAGDLDIAAGELLFSFSGASYELSRTGQAPRTGVNLGGISVSPAQRFDLNFEYSTFELTLGYRFLHHDFQAASKSPEDAVPVVVSLYGLVGGRVHDLSIDFRASGTGPTASYDELLGEPLIGARLIAEFTPQFGIDILGTVGYFPSDPETFSVDIRAGFSWTPLENVGVQIGYRQLLVDIEDGDNPAQFTYDGGFAGLFTGLVLRF